MNRLAPILLCPLMWAACASPAVSDDVEVTDSTADDAAKEDAANSLSSNQAKLALTLIDDACSDSWCERDLEWSFKKMVCHFDAGTCTMTTLATWPAHDGVPAASYWRSCKMRGLRTFKQLVTTYPNGFQSLTDSMWDKVDACVTKIENSIPGY